MFNIAGNNASGYNLTNSLRFRSSASAYLNRTLASSGNLKTFTFSFWAKRGSLSSVQYMMGAAYSLTGSRYALCGFTSGDTFYFQSGPATTSASSDIYSFTTTQVFRDPSAWYHFVIAVDTTQATNTNRVKIYVNGSQITAFSSATYPSQNADGQWNWVSASHIIGGWSGGSYFDGYLSEFNFVNAQALTPSSFGSTDAVTGSWIPKKYSGTYGTNGFYLPFTDNSALTTSSNVGLGKDFSGNTNYWVTNNISITAGTTYDSMKDVPTLTSATVANYAVLNPLDNGGNTLSGANLNISSPSSTAPMTRGTIGVSSGKWYWEVTYTTAGTSSIGIASQDGSNTSSVGQNTYSWGYLNDARKYFNSSATAYGASYTTNDVIGVALDMDAGTLTFYKNGVSQGTAFSSITGTIFPAISDYSTAAAAWSCNFGQRPFSYTPPTGFVALNTFNLPNSTIKKANTVMDATLYTGNGTTQTITNAAGFRPDLVWFKERSSNSSHWLFDTIRGVLNRLSSNETVAEANQSGTLTAFNSNGFSVGSDVASNESGQTYVGWQWQASASTVTNTSGTISAQVRASTTAGFSVVTYTGTGANATVGHGLGVAPKMIIVKTRNAVDNWAVYHSSTGATQYLQLNAANASASSITLWNDTSPTSTVFSVGTNNDVNGSTRTYVAYCWSEIVGFSKFGSYTGNGSADGTFVYTGFRPKFVMIKRTDAAGSWYTIDTSRATYNVVNPYLLANASNAEASDLSWDILSNGFKLRSSYADINTNSATMIYMAFAENPFKNANAR
jgi:hypothetical protein